MVVVNYFSVLLCDACSEKTDYNKKKDDRIFKYERYILIEKSVIEVSIRMAINNHIESSFKEALLHIDRDKAATIFEGLTVEPTDYKALENLLMNSLEDLGSGWEQGETSLAQLYMAGIICEELMEEFMPSRIEINPIDAKIAVVVLQDRHALGKRMVKTFIKTGGYKCIDLGEGLTPEELVEKVKENNIEVLLISTLMLSSALKVKEVKSRLIDLGLNVTIIVGGAPFRIDKTLWEKVGADAYGESASDTISLIEGVVRQ